MNRRLLQTLNLLLLTGLLTACSSQAPTPALASPTAPPQTQAMPAPSIPATPTAAPLATPNVTFQPEIVATRPEDIAGPWLLQVRGIGGIVKFDAIFLINADGTYSIDDTTEGMHIERGTFTLGDGHLILDSDECYRYTPAPEFFHCIGVYTVYTTLQGETPVHLRFVPVDDSQGGDRAVNLKDRVLNRVAP